MKSQSLSHKCTIQEMAEVFATLRPDSTFLHIKEYKNLYGEISNFGIVFHIDYLNCLTKSLSIVKKYQPISKIEIEAKADISKSISQSIVENINFREERNLYSYFRDNSGNIIKGIMAHRVTGQLYLFGLLIHKTIVKPVKYPESYNSEFTDAKFKIKSLTPMSKFRQFKLLPGSYKQISVEHIKILNDNRFLFDVS